MFNSSLENIRDRTKSPVRMRRDVENIMAWFHHEIEVMQQNEWTQLRHACNWQRLPQRHSPHAHFRRVNYPFNCPFHIDNFRAN